MSFCDEVPPTSSYLYLTFDLTAILWFRHLGRQAAKMDVSCLTADMLFKAAESHLCLVKILQNAHAGQDHVFLHS